MSNEIAVIEREFNGVVIGQRPNDRYIDATAMCRANGKKWNDYWRLQGSQDFVAELAAVAGIPATGLVEVRQGGTPGEQGTYVHPRIATHLAQWCSAKFAVVVSGWLDELLTKGMVAVRPMSAVEQLLYQAQMLVDQERRLASVEDQVGKLVCVRDEAEKQLRSVELIAGPAPEKSHRARINEIVRLYAKARVTPHQDIWNRLYKEVYYRLSFNAEVRARNSGKTKLDVIEEAGLLPDLYAIACEVLAF